MLFFIFALSAARLLNYCMHGRFTFDTVSQDRFNFNTSPVVNVVRIIKLKQSTFYLPKKIGSQVSAKYRPNQYWYVEFYKGTESLNVFYMFDVDIIRYGGIWRVDYGLEYYYCVFSGYQN